MKKQPKGKSLAEPKKGSRPEYDVMKASQEGAKKGGKK